MEIGFLLDYTYGAIIPSLWIEGLQEPLFGGSLK
jgi:hypothetical protein